MNLFFSAAKQSIYVDVVSLGDDIAGGVLQQAADITGGLFLHVEKPEALLKQLMVSFKKRMPVLLCGIPLSSVCILRFGSS